MSGTAVTALVFDAAPAQQGAAQFEAAGQRIVSSNTEVVNATTRTVDAQGNMERALARLTRQIDPAAAAQAKLEAGQRLLERAFQRGSITAEEQSRQLGLLEAKYTGVSREAHRAAAAQAAVSDALKRGVAAQEAATRRLAEAQAAVNRFAGVGQTQDYSARAADIAAYGAELDRLRAKFDPLFAAQQRYRADLAELRGALATGAIAEAVYSQRLEERKSAFAEQARGLGLLSQAHREAATAAAQNAETQALLSARVEALGAAAQKAAAYQASINQSLGVDRVGGGDNRAADIAAYGAELDRVRAKLVPLAAAQQQYKAALLEIAQAERAGAISAREAAAARDTTKSSFANQVREINGVTSAADSSAAGMRRFSQGIGQAGFQVQDFVVQVGSGQNALVALGQQGSQLLGIFGSGGAIAGAVLAIAAMTAHFILGKNAAEQLNEALQNQDRAYQDTLKSAEQMEAGLRRQNSQFLTAQQSGERYRQGLQGMGDELVRLARYYERLNEVQRENERVQLAVQQRALTSGGGTLQQDILRPIQGRISTAEGGTAVDLSGMGGLIAQGQTSLANVPRELQAVTQAAIGFRDAGRVTVEGFQSLINAVSQAKAGSSEYRSELEAYEKRLIDLLPRVREYEDAMRRLGIAQTAINPANADQVAVEGMRSVSGEVGGRYQTLQRMREQRERLRAGLASPLATAEDRLAARSSLQSLAQQAEGMTPATTQQLRGLEEQVRLSRVAEGAARELAQAELELDRAARAAGAGQASATEKAEARRLVQERLNETLATNMVALNRQITGEQAIAQSYARSTREGRQMEAAVRAQGEALKFGTEGSIEYERALVTLTTRYDELATVQAERQQAQRNSQSRDELAVIERENELVGASVEVRERELAVLRARQQARSQGIDGTDAAAEAERLAARLVETRQVGEQLRNSWSELSSFGERTFTKIGDAITEAFAQGKISAVNFGNIAKAVMSEVVQSVIRLSVINPALNAAFGGTRGTLGGISQIAGLGNLGLGTGQQVVQSADGSWMAAGNQASQSLSLYSAGRYGNLGAAFTTPGAYSMTGYGFIDNALNTAIYTPGTSGALTSSGYYAGTALPGEAGAFVGGGGGAAPYTVGNALGAGASVLGGAYGIYSGIQKGGIGGAVGTLGGALGVAGGAVSAGVGTGLLSATGSLAMLGPYGMIAAAVLAIVSALLPGQKPSGKGQETQIDLVNAQTTYRGLGGDRYSAGNREQSESAAQQIANLAGQLGEALGGLKLYTDAAVGVTSSRGDGNGMLYLRVGDQRNQFQNTEEGAAALADQAGKFLLDEFRKVATGDMATILAHSPDVSSLQENLDFYNNVWKSFQEGGTAANEYTKAQDQISASYQVNIDKAQQLSLATDAMVAARDKELARLEEQRATTIAGYQTSLQIRQLQANGGDDSALMEQATLMQFDLQARQQMEQAKAQLEQLGLSAADVASNLWYNEKVLADERLKIQRDYADQALALAVQNGEALTAAQMEQSRLADQARQQATSVISSLVDYARGLAFGDKSALSPQDQYALAQRQFNAVSGAALAGDANSLSQLQGYSDTLLGSSRAMFGSGAGFAADYGRVLDVLGQVPNINTDTLTASFFSEIQQTQTLTLVSELQALRAEVVALRTAQTQAAKTPDRVAA